MREKLENSILKALQKLIESDIDIIKNKTREECINHKLAQYLEEELRNTNIPFGNVDIEYNKYKENEKGTNGRLIRPDIIAHERKSGNKNNLIVIEAKKDYSLKNDRKKVMDLVDSAEYEYSLGVLISYFPTKDYIKVKFYKGTNNWTERKLNKSSQQDTTPNASSASLGQGR